MNRLYLYLLFICINILSCQGSPIKKENSLKKTNTSIDNETLKADIGEILLVGFRGQNINDKSHIVRDIQQYHVGSVILFEYDAPRGERHRNVANPQQLKKLCSQLQDAAKNNKLPLLISIDQEGGKVCRMRTVDGFEHIPSASYCASKGYDTVRYYAQKTAKMLSQAGINFVFAPVADVNVNPDCPIIGKLDRSFSSDTTIVQRCCKIWLDELKKEHIAGCMKHFPGHGSAKGDTHAGLVDVSSTYKSYELYPYKKSIKENNVPAIMVAHVINDNIDKERPASLSYATITKLLRNKLNFDGVVVTDDLAMRAITNHYSYKDVVMLAIQAGADMLCISNNGAEYNENIVPETVAIIEELIIEKKINREQIHASAERIRSLKRSLQ